jgi:hypothetical protein
LYLLNRKNPEYMRQPRWLRDRFWFIPLFNKTVPFITIPKPFLYGIFYSTIPERIFEWIDTQAPAVFDDLWKGVLEGLAPMPVLWLGKFAIPLGVPTAFIPAIEAFANRSTYTNKEIEPAHTQQWDVQHRSRPDTSKLAKEMSEVAHKVGLEVSPAKVQHLIIGYTAAVGKAVLNATNFTPGGTPQASPKAADIPFVRAFVPRLPNPQAEPFTKFYDRLNELGQKAATYREGDRNPEGPAAGAEELTDAEQQELSTLHSYQTQITDLNRDLREVEGNPDMSPAEKRQRIDAIITERNELAEQALAEVRESQGHPARRARQ